MKTVAFNTFCPFEIGDVIRLTVDGHEECRWQIVTMSPELWKAVNAGVRR